MTKNHWLPRIAYGILVVVNVLSLFWVYALLKTSLGEWPKSSYMYFVIWCMTLIIWSYRKLQDKLISVQDLSDRNSWPKGLHRFDDTEYRGIRTRHALYFIAMAAVWILLFMGEPGTDEFGEWHCNSVMARIALEHFGIRFTYDGFTEFLYLSSIHQVIFCVMSVCLLLILSVGGRMIHKMSEKRLLQAVMEKESE